MSSEYIGSSNYLLAKLTLKFRFKYVINITNRQGEERQFIKTAFKKEFLNALYKGNFRVKLVDDYPPDNYENDVFYIKKDGKVVWCWEKELAPKDTDWLN